MVDVGIDSQLTKIDRTSPNNTLSHLAHGLDHHCPRQHAIMNKRHGYRTGFEIGPPRAVYRRELVPKQHRTRVARVCDRCCHAYIAL